MDLTNKRVILIAPKFFNIETEIKEAIEKQGATVDFFVDKVFHHDPKSSLTKGVIKSIYTILDTHRNKKKKYWKQLLPSFNTYDILIWVDGYSFSPLVIDKLVSDNKSIKKILYMYDDTSFYDWTSEFKYFDRIDTFDERDSKKYNLNYLPLYWCKFDNIPKEKVFDLSFVGGFVPERCEDLKKLWRFIEKYRINIQLVLTKSSGINRLLQLIKFILVPSERETVGLMLGWKSIPFISDKAQSKEEFDELIMNSVCVLDLVKRTQVGWTNRSMQTIGNGVKIVTNNKGLRNAPFYDDRMIYILDTNSIDENGINIFIHKPVIKIKNRFLNELEINSWVTKL